MKKKLLVALPALLLSSGLVISCSSSSATLDKVVESKKIIVGTEAGYAPFEYIEADGELKGFDVKVVDLVVDYLEEKHNVDIEIEWKNMDFDSLTLAVNAGQVDLVAAAMTITEARAEEVLFSDGYFETKTSVVTLASSTLSTMDDLKSVVCGAQMGTVQADYISEEGWNTSNSQHLLANISDLTLQLSTGAVGALVVEDAVADSMVANFTGASLKKVTSIDFDDASFFGLAASKESGQSLIDEVNEALTDAGSSKLNELYVEAVNESTGE